MSKKQLHQTKKGAASLYVTIFVALILGVVTLSFARLAISELSKTGDSDLYASAYDSALAGVEDAKLAITKCLRDGNTISECGIVSTGCNDFLKSGYVDRTADSNNNVFVQENTNKGITTTQAYTCVTIQNVLSDYRSSLNSDVRIRVVPLTIENVEQLDHVIVAWHSTGDNRANQECSGNNCYFNEKSKATVPSVLSISVIQAGSDFTNADLLNDASNSYGTIVLYPNGSRNDVQKINSSEFASKISNANDSNKSIALGCASYGEFSCSANIGIPAKTSRRGDTTFLIVSSPYDSTYTDFAVEAYTADNTPLKFTDAQASVDSTGRANDVYRRVEARVSLSDAYYPYPQFGLELGGTDGGGDLNKNFWVTKNCQKVDNGIVSACPNSKNL